MEFRPCIDIHNGKVKQIVGGSLHDKGNEAQENFVTEQEAVYYAELYRKDALFGGHIILLNPSSSEYYEESRIQALKALKAYPGGMQLGGGITPENALDFLEAGAGKVIVTSYVFRDGRVHYANLERILRTVGREHLVMDVSCRKKEDGHYYVVTDRWQRLTEERVTESLLDHLSSYCSEFLIHAVDVEGRCSGIERELVKILGNWARLPVTYAGGVASFSDLDELRMIGKSKIHVTIGSSLDIFGGTMPYREVVAYCRPS